MSLNSDVDVAVVGAGFSGIATSAALKKYGLENVVLLEGGSNYGEFWATNYDRIKLHTPWHDLPDDDGLSDDYPMFKARLDLLDYFEKYAARHELEAHTQFDTFVSGIEKVDWDDSRTWELTIPGDTVHAKYIVVATGFCRVPKIPEIPDIDKFSGQLVHSKQYKNAESFHGSRVLVVGSGNSGCEIATDLIENGAEQVDLLVYGGRYMIPIDRYADFMSEAREMGMAGPAGVMAVHPITPGSAEFKAQVAANNELMQPLVEDLSEFGIDFPNSGPANDFLENNRVPVLDHGVIPHIRNGDISVIKDRIERFEKRGVRLVEGGFRPYDSVVMATGFAAGLDEFFSNDIAQYDPMYRIDMPKTDRRCHSTVHDSLYFAGFDHSLWGGLNHGHWGFEIAEKIATREGSFRPDMRPAQYADSPWIAQT